MTVYGVLSNEPSELEVRNRKLAREIAREGFVLLKNDNVLPIMNKKIALYGVGARKTVKGGTGSGAVNERYSVSIEEGLLNAGYEVTTTNLLDEFDEFYRVRYQSWRDEVEEKMDGRSIMETIGLVVGTPFDYPNFPAFENATDTDTAIYVLTRQAGEGNDRRAIEGDYFLTNEEKQMLNDLRQAYKHLILVINIGGFIDIAEVADTVDAVVFFSQGGEEGGNAFADLISGNYSFSGKLTNTWAEKYSDYPNADSFGYINDNLEDENYSEGIYVGYRYFDSFQKKVLYPFGFGLSYTNFEIETKSVQVDKNIVSVTVEVENIGDKFIGKEIVQVYVSCPNGKLEKEYQRLVSFAKTNNLKPNEREKMVLSFDINSLSSYDEDTASWILEQGDYVIRAGNSSQETSIVSSLYIDETITTEKCENNCTLVTELETFASPSNMQESLKDIEKIVLNKNNMKTKVNDYTLPLVVETDREKELLDNLSKQDMAELLRGGDLRNSKEGHITIGAGGKTALSLVSKGIGNITVSDGPAGLNICRKLKRSEQGIEIPLEIPERFNWGNTEAEAMAVAEKFQGTEVYRYATAFPAGILVAQTWNIDLAEQFGSGVGEEMLAFGITLWLAPGMNINRNPLCGRTFEYYSEDPFISGIIASSVTKGTQKHQGRGTTIKHFACNNQEDNRNKVSANVSERALREIYLKGFEITVKESQPLSLMSSYNRINQVYAPNNYDLLNKILRCEWGFEGMVMTDWSSCNEGLGLPELCVVSGNDLVMPGSERDKERILQAIEEGTIDDTNLRYAAARVLRVILNGTSNI